MGPQWHRNLDHNKFLVLSFSALIARRSRSIVETKVHYVILHHVFLVLEA